MYATETPNSTDPAQPLRCPEHDVTSLCSGLREACCIHEGYATLGAVDDPRRDHLLGEYRRLILQSIREDIATNLAEVEELGRQEGVRCSFDPFQTALGDHYVTRMRRLATTISQADPYLDGRTEERWWLDFHQFYLDGLALADRLLSTRPGEPARRWRLPRREAEAMGLISRSGLHALVNALEITIPDFSRVNPFDTYAPTVLHMLAHQVFPRKRMRFMDLLSSTLGWVRRGGFERLRGCSGPVARYHGLERLHDGALIDPQTGKTRHNLIIAAHHRLGYLDLPLAYAPLRGLRLIIWANNAFYGPGMEAKIGRDTYTIPVRGRHRPPMEEIMARTARLLVEGRAPLFIMADGSQPPLICGHQLRVKSGVRLAVNAAIRAAEGTGRRTYVLPMTINDPVGFVQGLRSTIDVRLHAPILVESVRESSAGRTTGAAGPVNDGDALLNDLEALFITETSHAVHGLPRPRIVAASRRRYQARYREPLIKRPFPATMADLARQSVGQASSLSFS